MDIKHIANVGAINENFSNSFVHVNKPFKCTCCCLERPEMIATYAAGNEIVGKVKQPFSCCDPIFTIYDNAGTMRYFVHADCCQCGICCTGFCAKMSEAVFKWLILVNWLLVRIAIKLISRLMLSLMKSCY